MAIGNYEGFTMSVSYKRLWHLSGKREMRTGVSWCCNFFWAFDAAMDWFIVQRGCTDDMSELTDLF